MLYDTAEEEDLFFQFAISIQFYLYFWDNCRSRKINRFHRDWRKWKRKFTLSHDPWLQF